MINIVQSMSEEDTEEEESGHCENKESEEDYCPREIRTPMNPRQRRMFGQLLHRRR